jgi:hypothetical protein
VGVLSISIACKKNEPGFESRAFKRFTFLSLLYARIDPYHEPQITFPQKQLCAIML